MWTRTMTLNGVCIEFDPERALERYALMEKARWRRNNISDDHYHISDFELRF